MFTKIRNRMENEQGFTLIELLVVILIIGILAAIAIPSFLNQREKGQDACAKSTLRTVQTAMETFYTDYNSYASATMASLNAVETQIPTGGACGTTNTITRGVGTNTAACADAAPNANNYCVRLASAAGPGRPFQITRDANGVISRTCGASAGGSGATGNGGGCPNGTW